MTTCETGDASETIDMRQEEAFRLILDFVQERRKNGKRASFKHRWQGWIVELNPITGIWVEPQLVYDLPEPEPVQRYLQWWQGRAHSNGAVTYGALIDDEEQLRLLAAKLAAEKSTEMKMSKEEQDALAAKHEQEALSRIYAATEQEFGTKRGKFAQSWRCWIVYFNPGKKSWGEPLQALTAPTERAVRAEVQWFHRRVYPEGIISYAALINVDEQRRKYDAKQVAGVQGGT